MFGCETQVDEEHVFAPAPNVASSPAKCQLGELCAAVGNVIHRQPVYQGSTVIGRAEPDLTTQHRLSLVQSKHHAGAVHHEVVLDNPTISRVHALVELVQLDSGRVSCSIKDLGSMHKTFLLEGEDAIVLEPHEKTRLSASLATQILLLGGVRCELHLHHGAKTNSPSPPPATATAHASAHLRTMPGGLQAQSRMPEGAAVAETTDPLACANTGHLALRVPALPLARSATPAPPPHGSTSIAAQSHSTSGQQGRNAHTPVEHAPVVRRQPSPAEQVFGCQAYQELCAPASAAQDAMEGGLNASVGAAADSEHQVAAEPGVAAGVTGQRPYPEGRPPTVPDHRPASNDSVLPGTHDHDGADHNGTEGPRQVPPVKPDVLAWLDETDDDNDSVWDPSRNTTQGTLYSGTHSQSASQQQRNNLATQHQPSQPITQPSAAHSQSASLQPQGRRAQQQPGMHLSPPSTQPSAMHSQVTGSHGPHGAPHAEVHAAHGGATHAGQAEQHGLGNGVTHGTGHAQRHGGADAARNVWCQDTPDMLKTPPDSGSLSEDYEGGASPPAAVHGTCKAPGPTQPLQATQALPATVPLAWDQPSPSTSDQGDGKCAQQDPLAGGNHAAIADNQPNQPSGGGVNTAGIEQTGAACAQDGAVEPGTGGGGATRPPVVSLSALFQGLPGAAFTASTTANAGRNAIVGQGSTATASHLAGAHRDKHAIPSTVQSHVPDHQGVAARPLTVSAALGLPKGVQQARLHSVDAEIASSPSRGAWGLPTPAAAVAAGATTPSLIGSRRLSPASLQERQQVPQPQWQDVGNVSPSIGNCDAAIGEGADGCCPPGVLPSASQSESAEGDAQPAVSVQQSPTLCEERVDGEGPEGLQGMRGLQVRERSVMDLMEMISQSMPCDSPICAHADGQINHADNNAVQGAGNNMFAGHERHCDGQVLEQREQAKQGHRQRELAHQGQDQQQQQQQRQRQWQDTEPGKQGTLLPATQCVPPPHIHPHIPSTLPPIAAQQPSDSVQEQPHDTTHDLPAARQAILPAADVESVSDDLDQLRMSIAPPSAASPGVARDLHAGNPSPAPLLSARPLSPTHPALATSYQLAPCASAAALPPQAHAPLQATPIAPSAASPLPAATPSAPVPATGSALEYAPEPPSMLLSVPSAPTSASAPAAAAGGWIKRGRKGSSPLPSLPAAAALTTGSPAHTSLPAVQVFVSPSQRHNSPSKAHNSPPQPATTTIAPVIAANRASPAAAFLDTQAPAAAVATSHAPINMSAEFRTGTQVTEQSQDAWLGAPDVGAVCQGQEMGQPSIKSSSQGHGIGNQGRGWITREKPFSQLASASQALPTDTSPGVLIRPPMHTGDRPPVVPLSSVTLLPLLSGSRDSGGQAAAVNPVLLKHDQAAASAERPNLRHGSHADPSLCQSAQLRQPALGSQDGISGLESGRHQAAQSLKPVQPQLGSSNPNCPAELHGQEPSQPSQPAQPAQPSQPAQPAQMHQGALNTGSLPHSTAGTGSLGSLGFTQQAELAFAQAGRFIDQLMGGALTTAPVTDAPAVEASGPSQVRPEQMEAGTAAVTSMFSCQHVTTRGQAEAPQPVLPAGPESVAAQGAGTMQAPPPQRPSNAAPGYMPRVLPRPGPSYANPPAQVHSPDLATRADERQPGSGTAGNLPTDAMQRRRMSVDSQAGRAGLGVTQQLRIGSETQSAGIMGSPTGSAFPGAMTQLAADMLGCLATGSPAISTQAEDGAMGLVALHAAQPELEEQPEHMQPLPQPGGRGGRGRGRGRAGGASAKAGRGGGSKAGGRGAGRGGRGGRGRRGRGGANSTNGHRDGPTAGEAPDAHAAGQVVIHAEDDGGIEAPAPVRQSKRRRSASPAVEPSPVAPAVLSKRARSSSRSKTPPPVSDPAEVTNQLIQQLLQQLAPAGLSAASEAAAAAAPAGQLPEPQQHIQSTGQVTAGAAPAIGTGVLNMGRNTGLQHQVAPSHEPAIPGVLLKHAELQAPADAITATGSPPELAGFQSHTRKARTRGGRHGGRAGHPRLPFTPEKERQARAAVAATEAGRATAMPDHGHTALEVEVAADSADITGQAVTGVVEVAASHTEVHDPGVAKLIGTASAAQMAPAEGIREVARFNYGDLAGVTVGHDCNQTVHTAHMAEGVVGAANEAGTAPGHRHSFNQAALATDDDNTTAIDRNLGNGFEAGAASPVTADGGGNAAEVTVMLAGEDEVIPGTPDTSSDSLPPTNEQLPSVEDHADAQSREGPVSVHVTAEHMADAHAATRDMDACMHTTLEPQVKVEQPTNQVRWPAVTSHASPAQPPSQSPSRAPGSTADSAAQQAHGVHVPEALADSPLYGLVEPAAVGGAVIVPASGADANPPALSSVRSLANGNGANAPPALRPLLNTPALPAPTPTTAVVPASSHAANRARGKVGAAQLHGSPALATTLPEPSISSLQGTAAADAQPLGGRRASAAPLAASLSSPTPEAVAASGGSGIPCKQETSNGQARASITGTRTRGRPFLAQPAQAPSGAYSAAGAAFEAGVLNATNDVNSGDDQEQLQRRKTRSGSKHPSPSLAANPTMASSEEPRQQQQPQQPQPKKHVKERASVSGVPTSTPTSTADLETIQQLQERGSVVRPASPEPGSTTAPEPRHSKPQTQQRRRRSSGCKQPSASPAPSSLTELAQSSHRKSPAKRGRRALSPILPSPSPASSSATVPEPSRRKHQAARDLPSLSPAPSSGAVPEPRNVQKPPTARRRRASSPGQPSHSPAPSPAMGPKSSGTSARKQRQSGGSVDKVARGGGPQQGGLVGRKRLASEEAAAEVRVQFSSQYSPTDRDHYTGLVEGLGGVVLGDDAGTEGRAAATHLLLPRVHFTRSSKQLLAIARGAAVVTEQWLQDCVAEGGWVEVRREHMAAGAAAHKTFDFDLWETYTRRLRDGPMMQGIRVLLTAGLEKELKKKESTVRTLDALRQLVPACQGELIPFSAKMASEAAPAAPKYQRKRQRVDGGISDGGDGEGCWDDSAVLVIGSKAEDNRRAGLPAGLRVWSHEVLLKSILRSERLWQQPGVEPLFVAKAY